MEGISPPKPVFETLTRNGWCFRDVNQLHSMIRTIIPAEKLELGSLNLIESVLLNMDLRDIGGKSLPDPSVLKKSSYLQGPKILQVVSVRDIYLNSIEASFKNSQHRHRLLRFALTDGHSEVTAIEYAPIPSITDVLVPGTKVRLENRTPIHSGILCLNSKVAKVLGGVVQTLYEEWEMNQRYSGFSRSLLRVSQNSDSGGPPPFEKLHASPVGQHHVLSDPLESTSKSVVPTQVKSTGDSDHRQMGNNMEGDPKTASLVEKAEAKPSSSDFRPKEVSEAVPVQNQAAAQKLLQKMSYSKQDERHSRGPKYRGKEKQEDQVVFTLDEWERRKGSTTSQVKESFPDISRDEDLARHLQSQLDMEDSHVKNAPEAEAEQIRMNMFNFGRPEDGRADGRKEFRGRGRERGRGRGRGRGRRNFG